jgi:hypothetical protein
MGKGLLLLLATAAAVAAADLVDYLMATKCDCPYDEARFSTAMGRCVCKWIKPNAYATGPSASATARGPLQGSDYVENPEWTLDERRAIQRKLEENA